jgi:hypothetical protein
MFFPMEIMLQLQEIDNCRREIYNFQRELDNFCGSWIIASGNFPIAVEKMIFPVGNELFPMRNYVFLHGNYVLLAAVNFFSLEIILRSFAKMLRLMEMSFFSRKRIAAYRNYKISMEIGRAHAEKRFTLIEIEAFLMEVPRQNIR